MQEALHNANQDAGKLSLSAGGAKRSRSGSAKGGGEEHSEPLCPPCVVTPKHTPDGRTCLTCPRRDDQEDPVAVCIGKLTEDGSAVLMAWAYRPPNGKTMGECCYYCMRVYLKDGKTKDMSMKAWKDSIAKKGLQGIALHHAKVTVVSSMG